MAIAAGAWVLHVVALALAPLSTVQVVLSTGVVILAVLGDRLFGHSVGRRQWIGVAMTAAGLVLLVLTMPTPDGHHAAFAVPGLIVFEAVALAVGTLLITAPRMGAPAHHHGALLGAAAGVLFGVGDVALKALTGAAGDGLLALALSPWLPVAAVAAALAFLASARGFQEGEAVPVIATTSTAANLTCIIGGILVFGDALAGGDAAGRPARGLRARRPRRADHPGGQARDGVASRAWQPPRPRGRRGSSARSSPRSRPSSTGSSPARGTASATRSPSSAACRSRRWRGRSAATCSGR